MGKASEFDDRIRRLTQEEYDELRGRHRPPLRLRREALERALDPSTGVGDVLHRQSNGEDLTVLHDARTGATAVAVPVEQYLQLVSALIGDNELSEVQLDGTIRPSDATLAASGVEQVDPNATWIKTGPLA